MYKRYRRSITSKEVGVYCDVNVTEIGTYLLECIWYMREEVSVHNVINM